MSDLSVSDEYILVVVNECNKSSELDNDDSESDSDEDVIGPSTSKRVKKEASKRIKKDTSKRVKKETSKRVKKDPRGDEVLKVLDGTPKFEGNPANEVVISPDFAESLVDASPIDFFSLFVNNEIIQLLVDETNRYAHQSLQQISQKKQKHARLFRWTDCTPMEMKNFLGVIMWMDIIRMPYVHNYWRKDELYTSNIPTIMPRNRFELLLNLFHCSNNEDSEPENRLFKLEKLVNLINEKFKSVNIPKDKIRIDEYIVPISGKLRFKQNFINERHSGVKVFKLCIEEGYCVNYKVYDGKEEISTKDLAIQVVTEVIEKNLNLERTHTDHSYSSNSAKVHGNINLEMNEVEMKNDNIKVLKRKNKKDILLLTNKTGDNVNELKLKGRKNTPKPVASIDYYPAKVKGFVDCDNQCGAYSSPLRRSTKWYRKIAFDLLLSTCVINAHFLFKRITGKKDIKITTFRENIIKELIKKAETQKQTKIKTETETVLHNLEHQPKRSRCSSCYRKISNKDGCEIAKRKAKKSNTKCVACNVYFCADCFFQSHQVKPVH